MSQSAAVQSEMLILNIRGRIRLLSSTRGQRRPVSMPVISAAPRHRSVRFRLPIVRNSSRPSTRALFDHAWRYVRENRGRGSGYLGVGMHEARRYHRRAYGSMVSNLHPLRSDPMADVHLEPYVHVTRRNWVRCCIRSLSYVDTQQFYLRTAWRRPREAERGSDRFVCC